MLKVQKTFLGVLLASSVLVAPVFASGLLGIIGDKDSGALVTIGSGKSGDSGLVNVGLGGGGGNIVDAGVGRGDNNINANVSSGGDKGLVSVDANVGSAVGASASVGGKNGLVDANVNVLGTNASINVGGGGGGGGGGNGGGGGGNNGGGNGGGGNGGGGGGGGNGGGVGGNNGGGSGFAGLGGGDPSCAGFDPNKALHLFDRTTFSGWNRASNIEIIPIQLCPSDRQKIAQLLRNAQKTYQLHNAIRQDVLIQAALSRTSYNIDRVLGVARSGSRLQVYIY